MLQKLTINNYAIIDHLVVAPQKGLNIVTGETGAGKSIILGALSLILGERADSTVLINKEQKCIIEAVFDVANNTAFVQMLEEEELDNERNCIIRREINTSGKSRAFINDTPVRLEVLNKLTSLLVDLHQQFDHLAMDNSHFQMDVLDAIAGNNDLRKQYSEQYVAYTVLTKKLSGLEQRRSELQKEADYKQYLLNELIEGKFTENEIENAEQQLKKQEHAERIIQVLQESVYSLNEGEQPILNQLKRILQQLQTIEQFLPGTDELADRISATHIELKDINNELEQLASGVSVDGEMMQQLQDKVDIGYKLLKKHNVSTTNELLAIQKELEQDLQTTLNIDEEINSLTKEQEKSLKQLLKVANTLSEQRTKHATSFSAEVNNLLSLVGMPNALFTASVIQTGTPGTLGIDEVQFYLDANKSGKNQLVHKAASGGEMSRIMLCIKSLTAKAMLLPTLIFDEVDTGISGEAAKQVGLLLKNLSAYHQVICITHQPQVAAKGEHHLFVYKEPDTSGRITTKVSVLNSDERIIAIAKMIGGENPGAATIKNATELIME